MLDRISAVAGWLGMLLSLAGLILFESRPDWSRYVTIMEIAALALLVFFFVLHFEALKQVSTRRSTRLGVNSVLMVAIFVAILGIVNFLSKRHSRQWDFSETAAFSLAPQTLQVLEGLKRDVRIMAFSQETSRGRQHLKDLLSNLTYHTRKISYQFIDPDKKPTVAKQYGITQYDTLVIESDKQETQVKTVTEQELTNALIRVTRDEKRRVRFLEGHGEHGLSDTERAGYSMAKDALEKQGFEVSALSLLQEGKVPDGTAALVVAGPERALLPQEKQALAAYLNNGGRALVLVDPGSRAGIDDVIEPWGVRLGSGIVVDTLSRLFGGDFTTPIVTSYPPHEITQGFNLATFFPVARPIDYDKAKENQFTYQVIAETSNNSWAKADLSQLSGGAVKFVPGQDQPGPLKLGLVVTKAQHAPPPDAAEEQPAAATEASGATLVVFGDSDFASNSAVNFSGNLDLFLNTISWLSQEKGLISIRPKENHFAPLLLTRTQGKIVMYVSLVLMPAAVFVSGLVIWRRRRSL